MTKFLNISTDNTLGGNSPSDVIVSSQKALKEYIDSHGGGGSTAIDNLSITQNSSLQIQAVGVIDRRDTSTAVKTWTGTRAQYDAIVSKDANTLYNITDDTDVSLTILEALYPVGSIYITTAEMCPLSTLISGSTWVLVSSGRVLQGSSSSHTAGTTIEAGLPNITGQDTLGWNGEYAGQVANYPSSSSYRTGALRGERIDLTNVQAQISTHGVISATTSYGVGFDASLSNSIYGNSTTVQPPAYVVNIFERTA